MTFDRKLYICDDNGRKFFGLGPLRLLISVEKNHSLHKSAEEMGLSYHKALNIIKNAEKGFGRPLLHKSIGGHGGGGSILTKDAKDIIEKYTAFQTKSDEALSGIFKNIFEDL